MKRPEILLIEDDVHLVPLLVENLEGNGYAVSHAATKQAALKLLADRAFVIVVSDLSFPEKPGSLAKEEVGYSTIAAIRALCPELPIVVASGYGGESAVVDRAHALGATRVLRKPFSRNKHSLGEVIASCTPKAPARRSCRERTAESGSVTSEFSP